MYTDTAATCGRERGCLSAALQHRPKWPHSGRSALRDAIGSVRADLAGEVRSRTKVVGPNRSCGGAAIPAPERARSAAHAALKRHSSQEQRMTGLSPAQDIRVKRCMRPSADTEGGELPFAVAPTNDRFGVVFCLFAWRSPD